MQRNEARSQHRIDTAALQMISERIGLLISFRAQKKHLQFHTLFGTTTRYLIALMSMTFFLLNPVVVGSALKNTSVFYPQDPHLTPHGRQNQIHYTSFEGQKFFKILMDDRNRDSNPDQLPEESINEVKAKEIEDFASSEELKEVEITEEIREAERIEKTLERKEIEIDEASLPPYDYIILEVADRYEIDPALIRAVIMVESSNNPNAVSRSGAKGLMQLMPGTARELGVEDVFDPEHNIEGGTKYLRRMIVRFDGDITLALAAYNAGSRHVLNYGGVPPFRETRQYVKKVLAYYETYQARM